MGTFSECGGNISRTPKSKKSKKIRNIYSHTIFEHTSKLAST
jgi:hypothetical protein